MENYERVDCFLKACMDGESGSIVIYEVCDMVICEDVLITHELTVRFAEAGSFQYLLNHILNDGIEDIPDYQYRIYVE